jgi:hypothetical protein
VFIFMSNKMFSIFIVYNQNLSQLSVGLLFEKIDFNSLRVEIEVKTINLWLNLKQISIQFNDCLRLEPISLRQLNANQFHTNDDKFLEIYFSLNAKLG